MIKDLTDRIKTSNDEIERIIKDTRAYIQSIVMLEEQKKDLQRGIKEIKTMNKVCDRIFKK